MNAQSADGKIQAVVRLREVILTGEGAPKEPLTLPMDPLDLLPKNKGKMIAVLHHKKTMVSVFRWDGTAWQVETAKRLKPAAEEWHWEEDAHTPELRLHLEDGSIRALSEWEHEWDLCNVQGNWRTGLTRTQKKNRRPRRGRNGKKKE